MLGLEFGFFQSFNTNWHNASCKNYTTSVITYSHHYKIFRHERQKNLKQYSKNIFLLKSVTKQHIIIKIIIYICLITKAARS
jgi:hypothetical protein